MVRLICPELTGSFPDEEIFMNVNRKNLLSMLSVVAVVTIMRVTSAIASQSGQAEIEINGSMTQIKGYCISNDTVMQFWSDGNDGPAQRDLNGDGAYLDTLVHGALKSVNGGVRCSS